MRLFVALPLPEAVRRQLALLQQGVAGARWVRSEQLHLTLAFLGEVTEKQATELISRLQQIRFAPFTLQFDRLGCFPQTGLPRVLWIGLQSSPDLLQLAHEIRYAACAAGVLLEHRPFAPHITLARLKGVRPYLITSWMGQLELSSCMPVVMQEFVLVQSQLQQQGAEHRVLQRFSAMD